MKLIVSKMADAVIEAQQGAEQAAMEEEAFEADDQEQEAPVDAVDAE